MKINFRELIMNREQLVQKYVEFKHITDEKKALEAVKQDGNALRYVNNQTEAICLEAVKQNGNALEFVEERFLKEEKSCEGKIVEVDGKRYKLQLED